MSKTPFLYLCLILVAFFLNACSSAPAKNGAALTAADSMAIAVALAHNTGSLQETPKLPVNKDAAHEAYLHAQEAELRGDKAMASEYMQRAAEFDPYNRYLGFKLVEKLMADGKDSLAFVQAKWSNSQKGKVTSSQLGLLARLYVREGAVDSCRKYFTAALDSSRNQDTGLLYDYSLFLEAIKDHKELIRVYDLLLPHVNYMPSLFQRQVSLLVEMQKDSAVIELFAKAHDVTGNKQQLAQLVEMLKFQKRIAEVSAIVDTLTGSSEFDDDMVLSLVQYYAQKNSDSAFTVLKKKFYEDGVRTPKVSNFLGHYEHMAGNNDSAKVHLTMGLQQVGEPKNFVIGAYQSLTSIAIAEEKFDDAVLYAEAVDSLSGSSDLNVISLVYAMAHQYKKAYAKFDSLIAFWDNWKPMEDVVDSASMLKMLQTAELKKVNVRFWYGRILCTEAQDLEHEGPFDAASTARAEKNRALANQYFEYVMQHAPGYQNVTYFYASNLERLKRFDEAFGLFDNLLKNDNLQGFDLVSTLNYYGYSLIDLNRNEAEVIKGLELVTKALEQDPKNEAVMDSRAWGLYRLGKFEEAMAMMLLLKDPSLQKDRVYWEHMAAIQEALGKKAEATQSYKKLLKIKPNHPEALRFLKKKK